MQRRIFIRQLDLARELHMPVCIHDRDAHGDTLAILKKEGKGIRGVLHCYSGSYEMARELIKMGWYIGVDGPLTFKNAAKLPEIVKAMPMERLLVETDAPLHGPCTDARQAERTCVCAVRRREGRRAPRYDARRSGREDDRECGPVIRPISVKHT